ncbi:hypothetical protein GC089_03440 [Cellulomonas sp. JZ18]|uniref:hypothetical protein n=1 Tax=Cellulomonas sp. JZ18 TaxID=2654191 RepID=UPI0012D48B0B|nr:hypothetical protein [Cellulomonas sp. JZ18]QGQ18479.1 hypothetical protein GC089_03440 [Cellulomonas sp. JZ18]
METDQLALTLAATLAFVALAVVGVRAAVRARPLRRAVRGVAGAVLVVAVATCWVWTWAPLTNPSTGRTCIEEPVVGMSEASQLATPECVAANRRTVASWLAGRRW